MNVYYYTQDEDITEVASLNQVVYMFLIAHSSPSYTQ